MVSVTSAFASGVLLNAVFPGRIGVFTPDILNCSITRVKKWGRYFVLVLPVILNFFRKLLHNGVGNEFLPLSKMIQTRCSSVNILRIFAVKFMYGINPKIDKIAGR
jgi:hypothetical protein